MADFERYKDASPDAVRRSASLSSATTMILRYRAIPSSRCFAPYAHDAITYGGGAHETGSGKVSPELLGFLAEPPRFLPDRDMIYMGRSQSAARCGAA